MPEKNTGEGDGVNPEGSKETASDKAGNAWKGVASLLGIQEDWEKQSTRYAGEIAHVQRHRDNLEKLQAESNRLYALDVENAREHRQFIQDSDEKRLALVEREVKALEAIATHLKDLSDHR